MIAALLTFLFIVVAPIVLVVATLWVEFWLTSHQRPVLDIEYE